VHGVTPALNGCYLSGMPGTTPASWRSSALGQPSKDSGPRAREPILAVNQRIARS
jgi:hypothetical protein